MRRRLGTVVPYRDRERHLAEFLAMVPPFLANDSCSAGIEVKFLIVEQVPAKQFNRGALLNAGAQMLDNAVDYLMLA